MLDVLTPPARYTPFANGRYTVGPGLLTLDRDRGNGPADRCVFQIDQTYGRFRENYETARAEGLDRYAGMADLSPAVWRATAQFMVARLTEEYPDQFEWETEMGGYLLRNHLTGEAIPFAEDLSFRYPDRRAYRDGLDALAAQVPEDVAIVEVGSESDRLSAVHVVAPTHWNPREKLGQTFNAIHERVPQFGSVARKARPLMTGLAGGGVYQRFGWSVVPNTQLNRHPEHLMALAGSTEPWYDTHPSAGVVVRVERQVLAGLPAVSAFLFFIRIHFVDGATLSGEERRGLRASLLDMSPETRRYKGIDRVFEALIDQLES